MHTNKSDEQCEEMCLTPVDILSRTLVVVFFQVTLPELVQPAPVRVPRIPFAGDGENLLHERLMEE